MKKIVTLLFSLSLVLAVYAESITLTSVPSEAEIVIKDLAGSLASKLGKTPLSRNFAELATLSPSGLFLISIEKQGYVSQSILVTELPKSEIKINLNLDPINIQQNNSLLDKSITQLFEAQRQIRSQQFDEAISLLKKIEEEQSQLSIIPEMIGGAFYLKKDMKSALLWYQKAYRLNPNNKDAFTMKNYLEKALGKPNE